LSSTADAFEQDARILGQQAEQHRANAARLREQADAEEAESIYKRGKSEYAAGAAAHIRGQEAKQTESDRQKAAALARQMSEEQKDEGDELTAAQKDAQERANPRQLPEHTHTEPQRNGRPAKEKARA